MIENTKLIKSIFKKITEKKGGDKGRTIWRKV